MLQFLWTIPALPFAGFLALVLLGRRIPRGAAAAIGVGSIGLSALVTLLVAREFIASPPPGHFFAQTLWTWIEVGNFRPTIGFHLDALSLTMVLVVTCVGFLIHLYSWEFMENDEAFSRFFAYMNLFVGSMLTLLLADNLLLLYLGWEGVGACSYLLIGFWYKDPVNGAAARKAFVVTRVGDTAMAIGLFLLYTKLGTLQIQDLMTRAADQWPAGSWVAMGAAMLMLGGAMGKSAQLPLQTWLPDAMAGPTPVSALIHAATMVTAGVYLIARTHVLFELAPPVQWLVAAIGMLTLLIAGFSALAQHDIKRVLAYSTISQIGYMFLALGVGAYGAALFHFVTHAFFKALLFLGAGAVILAMHEEHDMHKMGGLWRRMPVTFWTFLVGAASLAALPWVTAGFYSKDLILGAVRTAPLGGPILWAGGLAGAFLTSLYTFRMVFLTFFGEPKKEVGYWPKWRMHVPLIVLAVLSLVGGAIAVPEFLRGTFPELPPPGVGEISEATLKTVAGVVSVSGIVLACLLYLGSRRLVSSVAASAVGGGLCRFWLGGWGFDWLYGTFLVRPFVWIARVNQSDAVDLIYVAVATVTRWAHYLLAATQTGRVRWYATAIAIGAVVILAIEVLR
jgi:NADH-quinone oxidoreductase subunit L